MDQGWLTLVVLGVSGAALTFKAIVDTADTVEKAVGYYHKAGKAVNKAIIRTKIYTRGKSSRFFNFFWLIFTGHPIVGPEDDPPPPKPGGSRKIKRGPIATVGYGSAAQPVIVRAASSPSPCSAASRPVFCAA